MGGIGEAYYNLINHKKTSVLPINCCLNKLFAFLFALNQLLQAKKTKYKPTRKHLHELNEVKTFFVSGNFFSL